MALRLQIENETSLPDGGPLSITLTGKRGLDIGRDQHVDWLLPDPTRTISGKHCEVRYYDDAYWLHDVSTNGTYLNGSDRRLQGPHRLRDGDQLEIGHYVISVAINEEAVPGPPAHATPEAVPFGSAKFWAPSDDSAPPVPRRDLEPPREAGPVQPTFLSQPFVAPPPLATDWSSVPLSDLGTGSEDIGWIVPQNPLTIEPGSPVPRPRTVRGDDPSPESRQVRHDPNVAENLTRIPRHLTPEPDRPSAREPEFPVQGSSVSAVPSPEASKPDERGFLHSFAKGAGLPVDVIAWRDPEEFAELLGSLLRSVAADLKKLLAARAETKRVARSTNQTTVQALQNNPLKFSPTPEDALRLMFGRPTSAYLDAKRTFEESFKDLSIHQVKTYAAMQGALKSLVEDLDPQTIEETLGPDKGLWAMMGSRKARLWEAYVVSWNAKTAPHENGLVDAFMLHFTECYDRGGRLKQD